MSDVFSYITEMLNNATGIASFFGGILSYFSTLLTPFIVVLFALLIVGGVYRVLTN